MVCASFDDGDDSVLLSRGEALPRLREVLQPGNGLLVIGHNLAYDLAVAVGTFPELLPAVWEKLHQRECTDTMIREQLLNLSTTGKLEEMRLPDGSTKQIFYGLDKLVLDYLRVDISAVKKGSNNWRLNFDKLEGLLASQYPREAADYARDDARYTMDVYRMQQDRVRSERGHSSLSVDRFQTAAAFALKRITQNGMRLDPKKFAELRAWYDDQLSDERMEPLYRARILTRPVPAMPYVRQMKRAGQLLGDWTGLSEDHEHDWSKVDEGFRVALEDCGVKFVAPDPAHKDTKEIKRRVLIATAEQEAGRELEYLRELKLEDVRKYCEEKGVRYKLTDSGDVCTAREVLDALEHGDEVLAKLNERERLGKMVSTELPRMTWEGKVADVVHFGYKTLVETGRTSSYAERLFPSANGQNVDPRARPVYVPRDGFYLCSCDFSTLELVCVAQTCLDLFGHSKHAEKINAGYDLHAYLGSALAKNLSREFCDIVAPGEVFDTETAYRSLMSWKPEESPHHKTQYKPWRKMAKPIGLGFPGGQGPHKLVEIARKDPYNVDFVKVASERFETHPQEFAQPSRIVLYYAKKLHKMDEDDFRWTPILKGVAFAAQMRDFWFETYPEMPEYFRWVAQQEDEETPDLFFGGEDEDGEEKKVKGLCYSSPMGMFRAAATFTACANGKAMQTPAAEGFKQAIFNVARACEVGSMRGCLLVNEVHDELLYEVPIDRAHEMAHEGARLMVEGMRTVIRDVQVKANPCLMERWYKEAEPVFVRGQLVPWRPKEKAA